MNHFKRYFFFFLYTLFFKHFPASSFPFLGRPSKRLRYICCKQFFKSCGRGVNIERGASFGFGFQLEIGDNSGLGRYCSVPSNIIIGNDVMMAPNVFILAKNHEYKDIEIPMRLQGIKESNRTVIKNDVWIGRNVIFTPGRTVNNGSIVAAGTVLTKDFPPFSIIGGNPGKLIKSRKSE